MAFKWKRFEYRRPPGLAGRELRKPVAIVGAGPIGLAAAIELSNYGVASVLLDDNDMVSTGSRAICWSKRSLEIFDRLGIGDKAVAKGVTWHVGRTYHRDRELFSFDLLPEEGHKRPAFINLQQYYVEHYLVERALEIPLIDLRFKNRVVDVDSSDDGVRVGIETPDGVYELETDFLIACDGANSPVRAMLGLEFEGELFEERFLIADIEMKAELPSERRFWFEPVFHNGQSALLHKQPDNVYRIDLQLGWDADPEEERKLKNVIPRIEKVVGSTDFRIEWVSVYSFQCRRLARFVHDRVVFAGDSAHVVSPFGARGGNSGLQDVDNLCWRLAAVIQGRSRASTLECYNRERIQGADENIANSTWTTKFMTPADGLERVMRDQVLKLASIESFARAWVNSGRLSVPCVYQRLSGADDLRLPAVTRPGAVAADAPQDTGWLIDRLGRRVVALGIGQEPPALDCANALRMDINNHVRERYLGEMPHAIYLVRPDQVIAARWVDVRDEELRKNVAEIWDGATNG